MRTTLFIFIALLNLTCYAQAKINCIIFIDGKIPSQGYISKGYFDVDYNRYDFIYNVGDIYVDTISYYNLRNLKNNTEIMMKFTYKVFSLKDELETYNYCGLIEKEWLFYDYLIINITNTNKKKKEFHFGFYTPAEKRKHIKGEYRPM